MAQRFKYCLLVFLVPFLIHCGGSGDRLFGQQPVVTALPVEGTQAPQSNVDYVKQGILSLFNAPQEAPLEPVQVVRHDRELDHRFPDWAKLCSEKNGGGDSDKDGLSDDCETYLFKTDKPEYAALDPNVSNLALIGGKFFDVNDPKLALTPQEQQEWKKDQKLYGGLGYQNLTPLGKKLVQKFSVLKKRIQSDIPAFKDIFYNYSQESMRIDEHVASYNRLPNLFKREGDNIFIGLLRGDNYEAFPYSMLLPGNSVYYLSGFGDDIDTIRIHNTFMTVTEFHIAFPPGVETLEVAIGHPSIQRGNRIESILWNEIVSGGQSAVLVNKLKDHNCGIAGTCFGVLHPNSLDCRTADIQLIQMGDARANCSKTQISADQMYIRVPNGTWTNLTQGMISLQPRGGSGCSQVFNNNDPNHEQRFFKLDNNITSRVPGVVDFNPSLQPGGNDSTLMITNDPNDSGKVADVLNNALSQIPTMTDKQLDELKKELANLNRSTLSPDDQKLLAKTEAAIKARKGQPTVKPPVVEAPKKDDTTIVLVPNGEIKLNLRDMNTLADLGFTFQENGEVYNPRIEPKRDTIKTISPEDLDRILRILDERLKSGELDGDQKAEILLLLYGLKNQPGVDDQKIDDFINERNKELYDWTPTQLEFLAKLEADQDATPGFGEDLKKWGEGFETPKDAEAARKTVEDKSTASLTDPTKLAGLSPDQKNAAIDQRLKYAHGLNKNGFIPDDKFTELWGKISGLRNPSDLSPWGKVVLLEDGSLSVTGARIRFKVNTNLMLADSEEVLKLIAQYVTNMREIQNKNVHLVVEAHTDSRGTEEANQTLSEWRASAVREYLSGQQEFQFFLYGNSSNSGTKPFANSLPSNLAIPADHITSIGKGETVPLAPNSNRTATGRQNNRRVELILSTK